MNQPIEVTYEDGVLRPDKPLPFDEHQRLLVTIEEATGPQGREGAGAEDGPCPAPEEDAPPRLPDWCNVYEGLSDDEVADLESVIRERADLTRPS